MAAPTYPACGMVLKKTDAAGDMTATEMTMAWRRPSVPDLRAVEGATTAGDEEAVSLIKKALLTVNGSHESVAFACSVFPGAPPSGRRSREGPLCCGSLRVAAGRGDGAVGIEQAAQIVVE